MSSPEFQSKLEAGNWEHRVFAGVRRAADGDRLRAEAPGRLEPVIVDVADAGSIAHARERVETQLGGEGLDGLVNNAGIAVTGPLEHVPVEDFRRQLEVNVIGQLACTQAFLPCLRRGRGRVVFMGSIAGRMTVPYRRRDISSAWTRTSARAWPSSSPTACAID